jgi:glycosyltransferase involved in cell wall biosynthesis
MVVKQNGNIKVFVNEGKTPVIEYSENQNRGGTLSFVSLNVVANYNFIKAEELSKTHTNFHITMLGGGELESAIKEQIKEKKLEQYITLAGTRKPEEVRQFMEKAPIFLMTSDRQEGWGAVMNEAMNSGCAVIANRMVGATPFLIEHGVNGYEYRKASAEELAKLTVPLIDDKELCKEVGLQAYSTIIKEWNPAVAAKRLLQLCEDVTVGKEPQIRWASGPCSKAEIIKERS